jgi:predicted aconitase
VDVNAVSIANERAVQQAAVLQNQVSTSAEALRALVATTASTIAQQLQQITNQTTERLAAVEKAQYEGQGRGTGIKDIYGWLVGLIALGLYLWSAMHK